MSCKIMALFTLLNVGVKCSEFSKQNEVLKKLQETNFGLLLMSTQNTAY